MDIEIDVIVGIAGVFIAVIITVTLGLLRHEKRHTTLENTVDNIKEKVDELGPLRNLIILAQNPEFIASLINSVKQISPQNRNPYDPDEKNKLLKNYSEKVISLEEAKRVKEILKEDLDLVGEDTQSAIAIGLLLIGLDARIGYLEAISKLKDKNPDVRMRAAKALGRIGDARAVEPLIPALNDMHRDVRWNAVRALGMIGGTKAAEALTKALGDKYDPVRSKALEALVKIGAEAVESLIKGLKDKSITVRYNSAAALGRIGSPKAKDALTEVSNNDKSTSVRSIAKDALKEIEAKQKSK